MRRITVVLLAALLGGCAVADMPVNGLVYADIKAPLTATSSPDKPQRVGRASVRSVLGVFASGDASIQAAARNGGISEIHHVDIEASNFFGVLSEYTVVVYGN